MILRARIERFPLRDEFTISRGAKREAVVLVVELEEDGIVGRGEAVPYPRYGETPEGALEAVRSASLDDPCAQLPAGAARNAIDLALWDLRARRTGTPVWQLAGLDPPRPIETAYTIVIDDLEETRALARAHRGCALLKIKVGGPHDLARARAVRDEAPGARLIVDANEGWTIDTLRSLAPALAELGVETIEQPLPASSDAALEGFACPIPLCADESFHGEPSELDRVARRYRALNVKLDKQGGLTTAIAAVERARALGLDVMIGTMVASSLAVAPAVLLASRARWADVDGAIFLAADREHALRYEGAVVQPPERALWG